MYVFKQLTILISNTHYSLLLFDIYSSLIQLLIYCIPEIVQFSLLAEGSPLTVDDDLGVFSLVPSVFGYVIGLLHVACIGASAQYEANVAVGIVPAECHLCARRVVYQCHYINIAYLDVTEGSACIIKIKWLPSNNHTWHTYCILHIYLQKVWIHLTVLEKVKEKS